MNVYLTFDVEVWCGGWDELDARFPAAFERYCYGRSAASEYALPKTVETLRHHGLRGVFFVEPQFAARFGEQWLARIVDLLQETGQDVQLHLHPEWTDEITPPPIADASMKRHHLTHYDVDKQMASVRAFRAAGWTQIAYVATFNPSRRSRPIRLAARLRRDLWVVTPH